MADETGYKNCREHFVAEGFTLGWSRAGLLIRAIGCQATELLVDWERLLNMAEYVMGGSLTGQIEENPVIDVLGRTAESEKSVGQPGDGLQESIIVRALAEEACQRIKRKTIGKLQLIRDALHSGEDSGLRDAWDEICVQLQDTLSIYWDAYDLTVRSFLRKYLSELPASQCDAIWLQTPEGQSWVCDLEDDRDPDPVVHDDIVDYLAREYVYREACNWSNSRIRAYIDQDCLDRFRRDIES